jgi:hypothetical protein
MLSWRDALLNLKLKKHANLTVMVSKSKLIHIYILKKLNTQPIIGSYIISSLECLCGF